MEHSPLKTEGSEDGFLDIDVHDFFWDDDKSLERESSTPVHHKDQLHQKSVSIQSIDKCVRLLLTIINVHCDGPCQEFLPLVKQNIVLNIYGKRNISKRPVVPDLLSVSERKIYIRIRKSLNQPERRKRILDFIKEKHITKRLVNYFIVHYVLLEKQVSYYLDKRSYPYSILGDFNNPNFQPALDLISQGQNIVWINLHQEYKLSKHTHGRRNMHAPYARSTSVQGEDKFQYSLCELNFFIWFDEVGGIEAFYALEHDIRLQKQKYEDSKRKSQRMGERKHKTLTVLRNTNGQNYNTFVVNGPKQPPFTFSKH